MRIAGQRYEYVVKQLRGFTNGSRPDIDGTISVSAQPLSPEDIENLAHYIAAMR